MMLALLLAANFRAIGLTVAAVVVVGFIVLFLRNVGESKAELGSEVELAANRKPYLSDEDLEGPKLDKSLSFALIMLGICSLSVPFYWLAEPGRQEGAVDAYQLNFESRGEGLYVEGAQCVNCHSAGGVGGSAPYVLQDADGQFIANAAWTAPALNNVLLRYTEDEVRYILNYGRPGSPMAAWGTPGGGPLTTQQVQNIIEYIDTLQVANIDSIAINEAEDPEAAQLAANAVSSSVLEEVQRSLDAGEFSSKGEAVFNLGLFSGYGAGSQSCGRCHTSGWSLGPNVFDNLLEAGVAGCSGGEPSGIGFGLCSGATISRFPDDTWKMPDGSWLPTAGLTDPDRGGQGYLLAMDESRVYLNGKGIPIAEREEDGVPVPYLVIEDGDLADCLAISQLWEPGGTAAASYPFDPRDPYGDGTAGLVVAPASATEGVTSGFFDPAEASLDDFGPGAIELGDGRLAGECTIIDMPERTSQAHFDFIYNGAEAGKGYGKGGQSHGGMMPGFGSTLPIELIQAVVDYERGL